MRVNDCHVGKKVTCVLLEGTYTIWDVFQAPNGNGRLVYVVRLEEVAGVYLPKDLRPI